MMYINLLFMIYDMDQMSGIGETRFKTNRVPHKTPVQQFI